MEELLQKIRDLVSAEYYKVDAEMLSYLSENKSKFINPLNDLLKKCNIEYSSEELFEFFLAKVKEEIAITNKRNPIKNEFDYINDVDLKTVDSVKKIVKQNVIDKPFNYSLTNIDEYVSLKFKTDVYDKISTLSREKVDFIIRYCKDKVNSLCSDAVTELGFDRNLANVDKLISELENLIMKNSLDDEKEQSSLLDDLESIYADDSNMKKNDFSTSNVFSSNNIFGSSSINSGMVSSNEKILEEKKVVERKIAENVNEFFSCMIEYSKKYDLSLLDRFREGTGSMKNIFGSAFSRFMPVLADPKILDSIDFQGLNEMLVRSVEFCMNNPLYDNPRFERFDNDRIKNLNNTCLNELNERQFVQDSLVDIGNQMNNGKNKLCDFKKNINFYKISELFIGRVNDDFSAKGIRFDNGMVSFLIDKLYDYCSEVNTNIYNEVKTDKIDSNLQDFYNYCGIENEIKSVESKLEESIFKF